MLRGCPKPAKTMTGTTSLHTKIVLDLFAMPAYMPMGASTEGRQRGRATMGRDAAPPGVTRNRVPGRFSELPTAWVH